MNCLYEWLLLISITEYHMVTDWDGKYSSTDAKELSSDSWPSWKKWFEQFYIASSLSTTDEAWQVSMPLYYIGPEAESVIDSTNAMEEERKKYSTVLAKFDSFFEVRKNTIFERAEFNRHH